MVDLLSPAPDIVSTSYRKTNLVSPAADLVSPAPDIVSTSYRKTNLVSPVVDLLSPASDIVSTSNRKTNCDRICENPPSTHIQFFNFNAT